VTGDPGAAAAFAREHAHYTEDLALWRAVAARSGGPVLDLGCAAGRVAVPLAEDGIEVWALDADPGMLVEVAQAAAARGAAVAQRIRTVPADLRDFSLDVRVPLAIAAMNTLQLLLTPGDQLACLRRVREHLTDDGELWFDVTLPDVADVAGAIGLVRSGARHEDPATGVTLVHSSWYEAFDPVTSTADYALRVDAIAPDGTVRTTVRDHTVHLYTPAEIEHLVARAGFEVVQSWGGFAGEPLEAGAAHQVHRLRRAA
jgi:SAM-dependent methyltransferase